MSSTFSSPILLSLFCSLFFSLISFSSAFNVTSMLEKHPEFSTFNDLLSKTKLAEKINKRETITVLAVENSAASSLSGMSPDDATKTLSQHVILDYYDEKKLEKLNKTSKLTTLYQASGEAEKQQGFLNVEVTSNGVAFGSAAAGASPNVNLVNSVASKPYNISILQVSGVIGHASGPSSAPAPKKSTMAPGKAPRRSPANGPADANAPSEDGAPSEATSPSNASSPSDASSPTGSSPPDPAADASKGSEKASGAPAIAMLGSWVKIGIMFLMIYYSTWSLSV